MTERLLLHRSQPSTDPELSNHANRPPLVYVCFKLYLQSDKSAVRQLWEKGSSTEPIPPLAESLDSLYAENKTSPKPQQSVLYPIHPNYSTLSQPFNHANRSSTSFNPRPNHHQAQQKDQSLCSNNHGNHSKVKTHPAHRYAPLRSDTSNQMDEKVIVDSIGPTVLTITLSGATHSVSISTDVIRVSGPGGTNEHNLDSLPLIYEATALAGKLTICDGAGKMVYCWRSLVIVPSVPLASAEGRGECSFSSSLGPATRTEMIDPDSSPASASSGRPGKRHSASVQTGGKDRMSAGMLLYLGSGPRDC